MPIKLEEIITIQSKIHVKRTSGMFIYNFLINPSDNASRQWWPGVHLELHNLRCNASNVGNIVYMDEYVGERRLRMKCIVTEAEPGKRITWQFRKIIPLLVWLYLGLEDDEKGVTVTHTIEAEFEGA